MFLAVSEPYLTLSSWDRMLPGSIDGLGIIVALRTQGRQQNSDTDLECAFRG